MEPAAVSARRSLPEECSTTLLIPRVSISEATTPKREGSEVRKAIMLLATEIVVAEAETAAGTVVVETGVAENGREWYERMMG